LVNFEEMNAMILGKGESVVNVHTEHKIKRKRRAGGTVDVVTEPENKRYSIPFFKRRRMHDHSSVPLCYIYIGEVPRGESLVTARPCMGDDLKFKHPFSYFLSGPSGSGKTSFCIHVLQNHKTLCTVADFSGGIVWCYSEISAIPYPQLAGTIHVRFHEGVPADFNNTGE
jgi:hypothetical protein